MPEPVELSVGGKSYRVIASEDESTLRRLAATVDSRLRALTGPNRSVAPHALVLVALALAHELEEERGLRRRHVERSRAALSSVLGRIDAALAQEPPR
jgi:cell division protein ZapA